ncbi:MAG: DNA polymerase/3'-5' exonuclease PolX, partial [Candidatus Doudnabacteria bacterium]|nr:DNA polymerase/3'-5' exonuclease PolX [Candidatus Doudnabacteria bacterium]
MRDVPFKPRAYEKAALAIEDLDEQAEEIYEKQGTKGLLGIPGVGRGIAEHIEELLSSGRLKKYEQMRKKIPVDLVELASIAGVGPKTVKTLYQKLGIRTVTDLKKAAVKHKIRDLPGFGDKSELQILAGLNFQTASSGRFTLGRVFPIVKDLVKRLKSGTVFEKLEVGGSFRRRQETVGDIDVLGTSTEPAKAMNFFVRLKDVDTVIEHGETKSEIRLSNGLQVDLRIVKDANWGAALQYFTGDKAHNVKLRKIAIAKGYKLSEYGLTPNRPPSRGGEKKGVIVDTEEKVYRALDMDFIPPELRTDTGEIEAAQTRRLPKLIEYGDVRGDLQVQTNWTDGSNSIEELAEAARKLGREYICITDHTKALAMTGGLDERKLLRQMKEIDKLNSKFRIQHSKFRILKGAEVNILKYGNLDIREDVLDKLDIVGVSIHSHFKMSSAEMTGRIIAALSRPCVDIFFHPTARLIGRREPIQFDFPKVLRAAKRNNVALEVNAHPERLDLHDTLIRQAVEAGVKLVIDTDAHSTKDLEFLHFGEAQARRGWATKEYVLNSRPVAELLKYFS